MLNARLPLRFASAHRAARAFNPRCVPARSLAGTEEDKVKCVKSYRYAAAVLQQGRAAGLRESRPSLATHPPSPSLPSRSCPFYAKIGACRHGDRCSRAHNKPLFSLTVRLCAQRCASLPPHRLTRS